MLFLVILLAAVVLVAAGCRQVEIGDLQTDTETVELGGASTVQAEINMGAGRLKLGGGAADLLEATFTYNVADFKPVVDYSVSGDSGRLEVSQPNVDDEFPVLNADDVRYEWELRLNDEVPIDLNLNLGAGEGEIDLGGLQTTELALNAGAGKMTLDLGGSALEDLRVSIGAGEVTIDLTGDWANDLVGEINGGVGTLIVRLPASVGVRVEVSGGLGSVNASGLTQDGSVYTNDAFESAATVIRLDIEGGVGEIRLEVAE
jgi:hypothetical protein